jgi:hypothetical protein
VVDEANNSVCVVNAAPKRRCLSLKKQSSVHPEPEPEPELQSSAHAGGGADRAVLLSRLYEAWHMMHDGFSHMMFSPVPTAIVPADPVDISLSDPADNKEDTA